MGYKNDEHYFVQKDKYRRRAEKFLIMGAGSVMATFGLVVASPALGALALPAIAVGAAASYASVAGFGLNKIAENVTDTYEPLSKREKVFNAISSMREKAFGTKKKKNGLDV
jgi:hypothetical protein